MEDRIVDIISKIVRQDKEHICANADEEGLWDSFTLVEIVFALEDSFSIILEPDDIGKCKTVKQIIDVMKGFADET